VTFGGAYAVLGYVAHHAVHQYGWVTSGEMATGLGLAESTPGPLILVLQFVAFLGAFHGATSLPPLVAGLLGGTIAVFATFAPCFVFIFLGAPFAERIRTNARLRMQLATVSAAVVGVILNLAVWFTIHTLFTSVREHAFFAAPVPDPASVELRVAGIALLASVLFGRKVPTVVVIGVCALAGLALSA